MLIAYAAPAEPFHRELEIKKSIFIAHLVPVSSEEEAQEALSGFRKQYKDATHNCYAWRIGTTRILEKSGDDGEPQGTAGHPMLHVLQMQELTNVLAVVTRYFGGIKLGAGGLTRAYSSSLSEAVKEAPIVRYTPHVHLRLTIPYNGVGGFENYIKGTDIIVKDRSFTDKAVMDFLCLPEKEDAHCRFFTDLTAGKADIEELGEEYVKMERKIRS
ncbi:YigZ family protein [uncultured Dialister sp.]|uniref:YigZ family protein n=1 Tax=uncultured Dialister sp. TaxID=278064 RepID=UPI002603C715|nr:YigZ family protein [uncultured Dialister sp.]